MKPPAQHAPDADAVVQSAVQWLNEAYASTRLELAIRIGRYIRDEVMCGDDSLGRNHPSFRAIASHPELRLSHSYLWYALKIAAQVEELPHPVAYALSVSQHRRLTAVPDAEQRLALAERALRERWTVQQLDDAIGRSVRRAAGGRPPTPPLARLASEVGKALAKAEAAEEPIRTLASYERSALARELDEQIERLRRLRRLIG